MQSIGTTNTVSSIDQLEENSVIETPMSSSQDTPLKIASNGGATEAEIPAKASDDGMNTVDMEVLAKTSDNSMNTANLEDQDKASDDGADPVNTKATTETPDDSVNTANMETTAETTQEQEEEKPKENAMKRRSLKTRITRHSTKRNRHHVEECRVDFDDNLSSEGEDYADL